MVQNYKHVIQFHYKQKIHNHGYLDSEPRYILESWIEHWFFCVIFLELGGLQYNFQFFISFLLYFSNAFELYTTRLY